MTKEESKPLQGIRGKELKGQGRAGPNAKEHLYVWLCVAGVSRRMREVGSLSVRYLA